MTDEVMRKIEAIEREVGLVKRDVQELKTAQAVRDVQYKSIESGMSDLKSGLGDLKGGINRVLWVLGIAVLGAAAQFVIRGGLGPGLGQ